MFELSRLDFFKFACFPDFKFEIQSVLLLYLEYVVDIVGAFHYLYINVSKVLRNYD